MNLWKKLFGKWKKKQQEEVDYEEDWEEAEAEQSVDFTNREVREEYVR